MRLSSYRTLDGGEASVGVGHGERLHPVPGVTRLIDLLGDDGSRLRAAAVRGPHAAVAIPPGDHTPSHEEAGR